MCPLHVIPIQARDLAKRAHFSSNVFKRILIVDDEVKVTHAYRMLFLHEGFHVFMATSAVQAREILAQEPIDVVVMDINMPEVDGAELFEVILETLQNRIG
jgi:DNA-binding response OmpR family regulator